jgi:addiction module RelE/StbE family toxin
MNIKYNESFDKHYKKRISSNRSLVVRAKERIDIFVKNPNDPILKDHPLKGKSKGFRAFSITGDIRVIYQIIEGTAYFFDIGTHNQVY